VACCWQCVPVACIPCVGRKVSQELCLLTPHGGVHPQSLVCAAAAAVVVLPSEQPTPTNGLSLRGVCAQLGCLCTSHLDPATKPQQLCQLRILWQPQRCWVFQACGGQTPAIGSVWL
jgi:hypothetical protein